MQQYIHRNALSNKGDLPNRVAGERAIARLNTLSGNIHIKEIRRKDSTVDEVFRDHFSDLDILHVHESAKKIKTFLEFSGIDYTEDKNGERVLLYCKGMAITIHERRGITVYEEADLMNYSELICFTHGAGASQCTQYLHNRLSSRTSGSRRPAKVNPGWVSKLSQMLFGDTSEGE